MNMYKINEYKLQYIVHLESLLKYVKKKKKKTNCITEYHLVEMSKFFLMTETLFAYAKIMHSKHICVLYVNNNNILHD